MESDSVPKTSKHRVRLNKLLAERGIASRRACDKVIEEGRVLINGKKVYELGIQVDPFQDRITVDGKPLTRPSEKVYVMLNKPRGVLTTMDDPLERSTIKSYIEHIPIRLFPVGRLDWDSEGLLLLTNDGDYAQKITHPTSEVTKTYLVKVDGKPTPEKLQKLKTGVPIVGGRVRALSVEKVQRGKKDRDWLKIVITEGKNRQIRQMFEKIGFDVLKLQRVAIGRLKLGSLDRGEMVFLNKVAADRVFLQDNPDQMRVEKASRPRPKSFKRGPAAQSGQKKLDPFTKKRRSV